MHNRIPKQNYARVNVELLCENIFPLPNALLLDYPTALNEDADFTGWVAFEVLHKAAAPYLSDDIKLIAQNLDASVGRPCEQWNLDGVLGQSLSFLESPFT